MVIKITPGKMKHPISKAVYPISKFLLIQDFTYRINQQTSMSSTVYNHVKTGKACCDALSFYFLDAPDIFIALFRKSHIAICDEMNLFSNDESLQSARKYFNKNWYN